MLSGLIVTWYSSKILFDIASLNSGIPFEGVYPCFPSLIALIAASCMLIGSEKSGCPIT
jgi:hypothetical protein